jgi:hypothetical protein
MRAVVLVAVMIPVTILFVQVHRTAAEKKSFSEKERHGIEYIVSLWQLTLALTDAQSAMVAGRAPADGAVARAVAATGRIDQRLGGELRTHDRWAGLRAKIESLRDRGLGDSTAAYTAYTEASEMLLALYARVRENSELIRDPDADAYFLEDAGAEELPQATVAAGRLADLTLIAPTRPQADRTNTIATLTVVRTAVTDPAGDLTDDLRSAVDGTESRTLSGNLLSRLDLFQRGMDKLAAVSAPGADEIAPDSAPVSSARTEMQGAAADLGDTIYTELDGLIANRIDDLDGQQRFALAILGLAVLLVLGSAILIYFPRRRTGPDERPSADPPKAAAPVRRPLVTTAAIPGGSAAPEAETNGAGQPGWGRSGAAW